MKIWGLYSSRVDPYDSWELIELFSDEKQACMVRDLLVGKVREPGMPTYCTWEDDGGEPEFNDLHVIERDLR